MKHSRKWKEKQKKRLVVSTLSVLIIIMLILVIKLAGFSTPINTLANIKNYISKVFSGDQINLVDNSISRETSGRLGNTDTVTYIYDAQDLCDFRDDVNEGNSYEGKTVYLMNDIDLSTVCGEELGSFEPIGIGKDEAGNAVYFSGTFDGNYHIIDNLYMNTDKYNFLGLFTQTSEKTTVQNLILKNINVYNYYSNGDMLLGGIVGLNYGKILNCGIEGGSISANNTVNAGTNVGGIAGNNMANRIISCYNKAAISSTGLATGNGGPYNVAGGIVGYNYSDVQDCYNMGSISAYGNEVFIGGVIANLDNSISKVMNLYNMGIVSGMGTNKLYRWNIWKEWT